MHVCMRTYMHNPTYIVSCPLTSTSVCVYIYKHRSVSVCVCVCVYTTYIHIYIYMCVYIYTYICNYVCMCVCMCMYVCMHRYVHTAQFLEFRIRAFKSQGVSACMCYLLASFPIRCVFECCGIFTHAILAFQLAGVHLPELAFGSSLALRHLTVRVGA